MLLLKPRYLLIQFLTPLVWKFSNQRMAKALLNFALIEKDSAFQILRAIEMVPEAKAKAGLFQHALEELHHFDLFNQLSEEFSDKPLHVSVLERDSLFSSSVEFNPVDFFAFIHMGESDVNDDFMVYSQIPIHPKVTQAFSQVRADEEGHQADSLKILQKIAYTHQKNYKWSLLKAKTKLLYRSNIRVTRLFGKALLTLLLILVYYIFGTLSFISFRRRLSLSNTQHLQIFKTYLSDHEAQIKACKMRRP